MNYEVFIAHTAYEYQEKVKTLQIEGYLIAMVQYLGPQPTWIITAQRDESRKEVG